MYDTPALCCRTVRALRPARGSQSFLPQSGLKLGLAYSCRGVSARRGWQTCVRCLLEFSAPPFRLTFRDKDKSLWQTSHVPSARIQESSNPSRDKISFLDLVEKKGQSQRPLKGMVDKIQQHLVVREHIASKWPPVYLSCTVLCLWSC